MDTELQASSTSPRPSASAESQSSRPGDLHPPPAADLRPAQVGRLADMEPRDGGERAATPTPRVLVFSCESRKLSTLSPFQRREGCDRFGKAIRCEKLKDGSIEVEYSEEKDAKRALAATEFSYTVREGHDRRLVKLPVSVSAHRTKNSTRGVIFCFDLEGVSDEDIAEGLSDVGVTSARRIRSRRAGVLTPTHNIILTFNRVDLPLDVHVGYVRVKVRPYIPGPMRCFKCLRFGHTRDFCKNRPTCGNCAASDHTGEECTAEQKKCVNCDASQAPHGAFDPACPALQREKEIVAIKVTERVTFREARERYNSSHPRRSYANASKSSDTPQPAASAQQQQHGNIMQLISLLQSFGLTLSGPGIPPGPATSRVSQATVAATSAATTQTSPIRAGEADESNPGGGWTVVRSRRGSGHTSTAEGEASPPPLPPRRPGPSPTAVTEALRRGQEEQRAFEERRAGRIQKALEARGSARAEAAPALPSAARSPQLRGSTPADKPAMGPPPPPPPRTPRPTPPPPPTAAPVAQTPSESAPSAGRPGPPAEERPGKRSLPWEGSPTEGSTPRTRQRFQPGSTGGRSSSADGRLRQSHARIRFGQGTRPGAEEYF